MAGLVPAIHALLPEAPEDVDARDKPGHDEHKISQKIISPPCRIPLAPFVQ